jgi:hypothetical protein
LIFLRKKFAIKPPKTKHNASRGGECEEIVARLGKASILSDCLHEIYRHYEILGEEQYEFTHKMAVEEAMHMEGHNLMIK